MITVRSTVAARARRAPAQGPEELTEADLDRLEDQALGAHLEQRVEPRLLRALVAEARAARALRAERELEGYRTLLRAQELAFALIARG